MLLLLLVQLLLLPGLAWPARLVNSWIGQGRCKPPGAEIPLVWLPS
jgi:hypothetical protein